MTRDQILAALEPLIIALIASDPASAAAARLGTGIEEMKREQAEIRAQGQALPHPFGFEMDGFTPKPAPAITECNALWTAAQRAGEFDYFKYAPGLQEHVQPGTAPLAGDPQVIEDAIVALGLSPFGKYWMSKDVNAVMIGAAYQQKFNGYVVRRKSNNPDDGFVHTPA